MGNTNATHIVSVKTGVKKGAGTNGNVFLRFGNIRGKWSEVFSLDSLFHDDFEAGSTDKFPVNLPGFNRITELEISRDGTCPDDSWYLEKVVIDGNRGRKQSVFPVNRFIHAHDKLRLTENDSSLPFHDKHPEQRRAELEKKRQQYKLANKDAAIPFKQVEELPDDEKFNLSYKLFLGGTTLQLAIKTKIADLLTGDFENLTDFEEVYNISKLPTPEGVYKWRDDAEFGNQRIAGVNPHIIQLCKAIPEGFAVTNEMVSEFLEGMTLHQAMEHNKIFLIDLTFLENIECEGGKKICAPYGLFYEQKCGDLVPIAIQLEPKASCNNPVFLPSDPEYTWLLAKMWFNMADASLHQTASHIGFTHLLMESIAVCVNRQLSPSHPIYRLLAPHFLYLMAINSAGITSLTAPGALFEQTMQVGRTGMANIINAKWDTYDFMQEGHFVNNLKRRGMFSPNVIANYPYRDDGMLLWEAIRNYVSKIVNSVYNATEKLISDHEIQAWAAELTSPQGAAIKGMPGRFSNNDDLIEVLTTCIFISSVQHAAVNFSQYDEYGFPPNYPGIMRGSPPTDKTPLKEEHVVKSLADKETALNMIKFAMSFSSKGTDSLGYYDIPYTSHPPFVTSLYEFRDELKAAGKIIDGRNKRRQRKYTVLLPKNIPNAISI